MLPNNETGTHNHDHCHHGGGGCHRAVAVAGAKAGGFAQGLMRIAVPVTDGKLAPHFGHCEGFVLFDVDPATRAVNAVQELKAPEHQPGLLPVWLMERGVTTVIAGAMGVRAQALFHGARIKVVVGAAQLKSAQQTVEGYLAGTLTLGTNGCDH